MEHTIKLLDWLLEQLNPFRLSPLKNGSHEHQQRLAKLPPYPVNTLTREQEDILPSSIDKGLIQGVVDCLLVSEHREAYTAELMALNSRYPSREGHRRVGESGIYPEKTQANG
jgi:hypothetical protein